MTFTNAAYVFGITAAVLLAAGVFCGAETVFYVSPGGDDANAGTQEAPFARIERAREAVRGLRQAGLTQDVRVVLREGVYYLPDGLEFGAADGGDERYSVTYAAYSDETAVLIGGERLSEWRKYKEHVWEADLPKGRNPKQVFDFKERLILARYPNQGYLHIEGPVKGQEQQSFIYKEGDLRPEHWDTRDAKVLIWQGEFWSSHWFSQDKGVVEILPGERTVRMENAQGYAMNPGNEYYFYNVPEELDVPGEAQISHTEGKVRVWPKAGPIQERTIIVSTANHLLRIKGTEQEPVRNLCFENLDLSISNAHGVYLENTQRCRVRFCRVMNAAQTGVYIYGRSQHNEVYGNEIYENGYAGVELQGLGHTLPDLNNHHRVENNHIHHCGRLIKHGRGVDIVQSSNNQVLHNHIHHMPRYGTAITGLVFSYLKDRVKDATPETRYDYIHSNNNLIAYNHIHHVNLETQDTGAIESWGPGRDNTYDHNLVHDVGNSAFTIQSGIYLDDATNYFTVTNNIVYNVYGQAGSQPILSKGVQNVFRNNILIVNRENCCAFRTFEMANEANRELEFVNNIVYYEPARYPLQDYGIEYEWKVMVEKEGDYTFGMYYSTGIYWSGRSPGVLNGMITVSADNGEPTPLKIEGEAYWWDAYKWAMGPTFHLKPGVHVLRWYNRRGGGVNVRKIVLCMDAKWGVNTPGPEYADPEAGLLLEKVEITPYDYRSLYEFNNWDENRFAKTDNNVFWKHGDKLFVQNGPADGSYQKWVTIQDGKYDRNSVIADPMFYNAAGHDYRLKPESPALKLGFKPIAIEKIGLKEDYPQRLSKE